MVSVPADNMPFCLECGAQLPDTAKYCSDYGVKQLTNTEPSELSKAVPTEIDDLDQRLAMAIDERLDFFEHAWAATAEAGPPEGYPEIVNDIELFLMGFGQGYLTAGVSKYIDGQTTRAESEEIASLRSHVYPFISRRKDRIRSICGVPEWGDY